MTTKRIGRKKGKILRRKQQSRKPQRKESPSTAIVRVSAPLEKPWELDSEQVTILKNSVAKGATDEELKYCLTVARRYRLDPFKKQIWFVPRWDSGAMGLDGKKGATVWTPQVGIDGLLFTAARDHHKDFGSISLPVYGPMIEQEWYNDYTKKTLKFMAPEWAKVKVWKKGETEPTEAEAWWSEYAPADLSKAPFWRKMPRRMVSKCAKALAIREAYPDLGGLYIPEEMERLQQEFAQDLTPNGRQIVDERGFAPSGRAVTYAAHTGSHEAGQAVAASKNAGTWCEKHGCDFSKCPSDEHSQTELDSRWNAEHAKKTTGSPERATTSSTPWKQPPDKPLPAENAIKPLVELDWTADESSPVLRGDTEIIEKLKGDIHAKWGKDEFWHVEPRDTETIRSLSPELGFRLTEILPKQVPAGARAVMSLSSSAGKAAVKGKGQLAPKTVAPPAAKPGLDWMTGIVKQANPSTEGKPRVNVLLKTTEAERWISTFDQKLFPFLLDGKHKGKEATFIIERRVKDDRTYTNIVGIKKIGNQEFEDDGKTSVIQNKTREAGGRTLFP